MLNSILKLVARRDGEREVIEPDAKLGKLSVLAKFVLDQAERESRGRMHHMTHARRYS